MPFVSEATATFDKLIFELAAAITLFIVGVESILLVESTQALMGDNFHSYGLEANRKALDALFRYAHEQGLAKRRVSVEEMFEPSTLALTEG